MYGWQSVLGFVLFGFAAACGGAVGDGAAVNPGSGGGPSASSGGGSGIPGAGGRTSSAGAGFGGAGRGGAQSTTGGAPFVDPGCPDVAPPPARVECDPLAAVSDCPFGTGCYPYVDHPFGTGCDTQTYGALCLEVGSGTQGAECGDGTSGCAPSFICVVGAHPGRHCAKLCTFDGPNTCPPGMLCGDVDIQGYGVCF